MSAVSLNEFLVGRVLFPATNWLLNRKRILPTYRELVASDGASRQVLEDLQRRRLKRLIAYADRWCPFYTERFRQCGLNTKRLDSLDDLTKVPPLTRSDVIENRAALVDLRRAASVEVADSASRPPGQPISLAPFRRHNLVRNTSTGSTGSPVVFYENGTTSAMSWAHELRLKQWFGVAPGQREARFARVSTEYVARSRAVRARKHLWHQLVLPGMNLGPEDYAAALERVREFRPKVLFGITSGLTGFAEYVRDEVPARERIRPEVVITWAAPVYEHEQRLLADTFGCAVSNIYGSREVGHVAGVCPHGSLHINQEFYHVEIERDENADAQDGAGQILVTPLFISPMPFIRYRLGDVGELSTDPCPCGHQHVVLKNVLGRSTEIFKTPGGRRIPPNFWCRAFMGNNASQAVKQFQVVLCVDGTIRFRLVRHESYDEQVESSLRQYLSQQLEHEVSFTFEYVDDIPPQPSGKFQMVVDQRRGTERPSVHA